MVLSGPQIRATLDVVSDDSGDHVGVPVHSGRSDTAQAAATRAWRATRRLRERFIEPGRAPDVVAATRVLVVFAAIYRLHPGVLRTGCLVEDSWILVVFAPFRTKFTVCDRALW